MFRRIVRPNLELRPLNERDAPAMYAVIDANRDYIGEFLPWVDKDQCPEDLLPFIRAANRDLAEGNAFQAGIWEDDTYIGGIGIHPVEWPHRKTSIGYWIAADRQGQGIVTDCCRSLLAYCFDELDLHRVFLEAATGNTKSCAIAERLGMTREGILRQSLCVHGEYLDLEVFSILRPEWDAQRGRDV